MLLRELLPSVLLLELLLDDFENFNMEGKGKGVEKVFIIKETHKIMYTSLYVRSTAPYFCCCQRKLLSLPLFKPQQCWIDMLEEPYLIAKSISMVRMLLFHIIHVHINGVRLQ